MPSSCRLAVAAMWLKSVGGPTLPTWALADRLCDRANAIENIAKRDLAYDLRLASRVITALVRSFNSSDAITLDGNSA